MSKLADVRTQSSHGTFHFMMSYIAFSACFVLSYILDCFILFSGCDSSHSPATASFGAKRCFLVPKVVYQI